MGIIWKFRMRQGVLAERNPRLVDRKSTKSTGLSARSAGNRLAGTCPYSNLPLRRRKPTMDCLIWAGTFYLCCLVCLRCIKVGIVFVKLRSFLFFIFWKGAASTFLQPYSLAITGRYQWIWDEKSRNEIGFYCFFGEFCFFVSFLSFLFLVLTLSPLLHCFLLPVLFH